MGIIVVLLGGVIGAVHAFRKKFVPCWLFLIDLAFALYVSIFVTPVILPLLDFPGLKPEYKSVIVLAGVAVMVNFILKIITEQVILQNEKDNFKLPALSRVFSVGAGFLSGIMVIGFFLYCFMQTPFAASLPHAQELHDTAGKTLMGVVRSINTLSFQSLSPEAEEDMKSLDLLPGKKSSEPDDADPRTGDQTDGENTSDADAVKKDPVSSRTDSVSNPPDAAGGPAKEQDGEKSAEKSSSRAPGRSAERSRGTGSHWRQPPAHPWPLSL